jgi:penicillin-binding protein 2
MSFHPNDVVRRSRAAGLLVAGVLIFLLSAFYRTQVLEYKEWGLQSETNRLRHIPMPAPRGVIYDRKGQVIAENVVGYSVSILVQREDSLRAVLQRLSGTIELSPGDIEGAIRRYRKDPARPAVIIPDASFDVVSVLEEHRTDFPGLIIQSAPKRFYPESTVVATFSGYTSEISEKELASATYAQAGYKQGMQIGKQGLEKQYEAILRGKEGSRFVEVDARNRIVREGSAARPDLLPEAGQDLKTNIDMDLQRFTAKMFTDSALIGAAVALDPKTGAVLALYSAPSWDPNRFIGGVSKDYYASLNTDERRPLYNKTIQGRYPPGSTWKLATAIMGLERGLEFDYKFPISCSGGMQFGNRYFKCWDKRGHGPVNLTQAIAKSCDVYFYQLGLRITLEQLALGGARMGFGDKTDIDIPNEQRSLYPESIEYYNRRYGKRGWSRALTLNISIGQGENSQTVLNMARFYTALANDGLAAKPEIVQKKPEFRQLYKLTPEQNQQLRAALASVVSSGTAAASAIQGIPIAGKTGTAQSGKWVNGVELDHAWFTGFAPANDPKIVVAVMIEYGAHGSRAAKFVSAMIGHYLKAKVAEPVSTDG